MPKLDFDTINLGHGSGGVLTHRLLDAGVFSLLDNVWLREQHDGAKLDIEGPVAFTTDSFVVSPIFFPGGNIGDLAVNGTVNDLAMCGAIPKFLSLGLILEEGLEIAELWEVLVAIRNACAAAGVHVVTGDTKVVERGKGDKIFINTTGIGTYHPKASIHMSRVEVGDKIILSGPLANHGICIMSKREGLEFETDVETDSTFLSDLTLDLLDHFGEDIHFFRDPTRGGLGTVMAEIAHQGQMGIDLFQKSLPMDDQVAGACEMLGLDPLYVANEGLFVTFVKAEAAEAVVDCLHQHQKGQRAAIIGEVTEEHPGKVVLTSLIGGQRIVNMLPGEQLPRIC
ncbi:MAG: hydrogenase expression/formation protein HypE [Bacteroidota bacterium]